ncbi:hypothetical protein NLM31_12960 [Bradyrhizobium sp. CCGUVB4N]|uniref:hypothetical protein n=1 Tax=Bradyrhizobium sp. CCGUVB4N TaxID=2949631 RepID=UPI0020B21BCF|nr:hypothetical protein [Bradyrhizobium sp. CCGUVB4N]MCP3381250.1 hypothetical protein [Bradyrhizobium sp. CCGUVB4N]
MIEVHKIQDSQTGEFTFEQYLKGGVLHRDPNVGPALVRRTPKGTGILKAYYWEGRLHSPDHGPAIIEWNEGDIMPCKKGWFRHGYLHSTGGPAVWSLNKDHDAGPFALTDAYFVHGYNYRDPAQGPKLIHRDWHTGQTTVCQFTSKRKFIGPCPSEADLSKLFKRRADRSTYDLLP